jgi:hypothetical protein
MRSPLIPVVLASLLPAAACSLFAKSPALQDPLHDRLAKADLTTIEDAAKTCLSKAGWKPNDVGSYSEGATVVTAHNAAKEEMSVYIQPQEVAPRVTGGPGYNDPFWGCLGKELEGKAAPAAEKASDDK